MTFKIIAIGKDRVIHCVSVDNKSVSACDKNVSIAQVNPDFDKLSEIVWCYECSHILETQEEIDYDN